MTYFAATFYDQVFVDEEFFFFFFLLPAFSREQGRDGGGFLFIYKDFVESMTERGRDGVF